MGSCSRTALQLMGSGHWSEEDWYLLAGLAVCFLLQCLLR